MRRPCSSRSSPTLTMPVTSVGSTTSTTPESRRAAPTPPHTTAIPEPATAEAETTPHGLAGEAGAAAEAESSKSWWFATAAPFTTLTKVLTSTQVARNLLELGMLAEAFETGPRPVKLDSFSFRPPARDPDEPDPPLSWYLSPSDQRRLDTDWESAVNREELDRLIEVFRAPPAAEIESAEPAGTAPGSDGP